MGMGAYHSGVEIGGKEYTFAGGAGIFDHAPRQAPGEENGDSSSRRRRRRGKRIIRKTRGAFTS